MGLRPSVKSDDSSSKMSSTNSTNNNETATSNSESSATSTTTSSPPQRQAWTVRGQLLLNFHDAISRAINSSEMIQKCNDIAKDMSRNDDESDDTKTNASIASQSHHQQHNTKSIAQEYEAEAALIVENKTQRDNIVRNKSIAVGLFAFITLRSGRGISSLVRKAIANRSSVYKFDNIPSSSSASSSITHTTTQTTTISSSSSVKQPSTVRKFINLSIDISISTTLTLLSGTYIFIPRPSSYIEDMSQLPLVQGKSVYAEMVCPPLIKEYRKVMEQFGGRWPVSMSSSSSSTATSNVKKNENDIELTQEDVSLNIIRKFVENCSKRSKYERALLEERNAFNSEGEGSSAVSRMMRRITGRDNRATGENAHNVQSEEEGVEDKHKKIQRRKTKLGTVSIPSPGVPEDVAVDVDLDVFDLVEEEEE